MTKYISSLHQPKAGFFILRWTVAGLMLLHGVSKLMHGLGPIEGMLVSSGLPAFIAYGVLIGEVVAPLFVLANRFVVLSRCRLPNVFLVGAKPVPQTGRICPAKA